MSEANGRRISGLLFGPLVVAAALTSCSGDSGSGGTAGSTSASGALGIAGNTGQAGSALGGANTAGGSAGSGLAGFATAGSGGVATGSSAGATSAGGNTGGSGAAGASSAGATEAGAGGAGPTGVAVKLDALKQEMAGFGINNTWATAMTVADADAMFNTTGNGLGLSILRVGMGSDGGYMSANISGDIALAKARGIKTIIGSCWSPPGDWKTEHPFVDKAENDGGHVKPEHYVAWADRITKFAKDNGLYAMSIGNEPDFASCGFTEPCNGNYPTTLYTAEEMVAFVKVAGPKLQAAGIKVIAPEASEWIHNWSNTSATGSEPSKKNSTDPLKCGFPATMCAEGKGYDYGHALFKDKAAWAAFDIMGVHQYDTQVAEPWPADVPSKKPVWQTEMSGVKHWPEQGPSSDIDNGLAVAGWIHNAVTIGEASAWLWWWWNAYNTDDNEGLRLGKTGATDTKRRYTLGNYSKFIRPGYTRVDVTGSVPTDVLLSAYKGPDGTLVVVAINKGSAAASVPIAISGGTAPTLLTPWLTSAADNLKSGSAIPVTSGSFTAALASKTVTTFVGK
jgi:glucuronoarabinoxylan endo-1,4-beta-xylanase